MPASRTRTTNLFRKLQRLPAKILSEPNAEAVHQLRTTIRRLETLVVHAGAPSRKERKLLKQLDRIRKRAGKVRDVDVQIAALSNVKGETIGRDKARVMRALEKNRRKREQKLTKALEAEVGNALVKRLVRTRQRVLERAVDSAEERREKTSYVAGALDKFAVLMQQNSKLTEQNLHDFRMGCKRLRYEAEMGENEPNARRAIEQLKRMQDAVGEWHDWVTLTESAEQALSRHAGSPLIPLLRTNAHAKFLHALQVVSAASGALLGLRSGPARKGPRPAAPRASTEAATHAASA